MQARIKILGTPIDPVTMAQAIEKAKEMLHQGGYHQIVTANPEILYQAQKDQELQKILEEASLVTADGIGVVWASRKLATPVPERVTGIDLMASLLEESAQQGWPCFFLGSAPGIAEKAAEKLKQKHPTLQIAGTQDGYFPPERTEEITQRIKTSQTKILFVGLGAPRQERWIHQFIEKAKRTSHQPLIAIGIGGSMDVLAGKTNRAPQWIQKLHLEWLYRLSKEPHRIKRQLNLPLFAIEVLKQSRKK
ncbi:WecB/TagA/CpsF family glycosyltransferase [Heliorestis convoluta]|uniref:N-acetylglucosaminyldiphosphoundecaprenol N-acetyl-beta-D-mannosaminyltransferase n=1 Tax=Heliorestis convoluta TaxID=356322 RepID=A0A5Q2MX23_9FIRM|nr:WecB/TagA/CpsF family glycosyltransferase [Heliorestis convoluta]QGG47184.1 glycosyltransferase, WecB/TagA/CpsF family protein [Heliorestis convoluta]